jgi:transcriptional regulator with XRE-family HTH domain
VEGTMLSKNLREFRLQKKMTQTELSKKTNLSIRTITLVEKGIQENPTLNTLKVLAKTLGVSVDELIK